MTAAATKTVTFIQYDIPPLKSGSYTLLAHQTVNQPAPNNDFQATKTFAVAGNRFQLAGDDVVSTFPPANANGSFDGVLPHVVLKRAALPWQRTATAALDAPWLAVLLFDAADMPPVQKGTAADLIPLGDAITVTGSSATGTGAMPTGTVSYPGINPLDYGETPASACSYIDVDATLFAKLAPSGDDLPWLAHIREVDTLDSADSADASQRFGVVLGNRVPPAAAGLWDGWGVLVSLENMGPMLPGGASAPTSGNVRLLTYAQWHFFSNDLDESFQALAEGLNRGPDGTLGETSLRVDAPAPDPAAVATAITDEALAPTPERPTPLSATDAAALVNNALAQGYVPLDHHLRTGGSTVSWYRGPLLPYLPQTTGTVALPAFGPDALLRYDPQTGMFDASYAAAWQLGQLLALQTGAVASALYAWKRVGAQAAARQQAASALVARLGASLPSFANRHLALTAAAVPAMPDVVAAFVGRLQLLVGIPFATLVPSEAMLPAESMRLFAVDADWTAALVDGALSIGRTDAAEQAADAVRLAPLVQAGAAAARLRRTNDRPALALAKADAGTAPLAEVTGLLLRSALVSGWPRLQINGYSDAQGANEIPKLRMERLAPDTLLCLFEGTVALVAVHEAPEQLHCGIEIAADGTASTTLRAVTGSNPGQQFLNPAESAGVPLRADGRTLQVAAAAQSILAKLNTLPQQSVAAADFTSAEFALEMVKGVVKVEFTVGS